MSDKQKSVRQLPIYLTHETHRRLRVAAAIQERSMTSFAAEAIEKELDRLEKKEMRAAAVSVVMGAGESA